VGVQPLHLFGLLHHQLVLLVIILAGDPLPEAVRELALLYIIIVIHNGVQGVEVARPHPGHSAKVPVAFFGPVHLFQTVGRRQREASACKV
jgi:hypothetical protein